MRGLMVLLLACTAAGCSTIFAPEDATQIRPKDTGRVAFDSVVVTFPAQRGLGALHLRAACRGQPAGARL